MMSEVISVLVCLWVAKRLRRRKEMLNRRDDAWALSKRSLRWGMALLTLPVLGYWGAMRFADGQGMPSRFTILLCMGLTTLVMIGTPVEVTGNVIVDGLLVSGVVVAACLNVLNGLPVAYSVLLSTGTLCMWFLASVGVAVVIRAIFWARKGE